MITVHTFSYLKGVDSKISTISNLENKAAECTLQSELMIDRTYSIQ